MNVTRKTEPQSEPITLEEAKAHLNIVDFTDDDTYITALISVARRSIEDMTGRTLIDTVLVQTAREWCASIGFLRGNAHTIDSIKYDDAAGTEQTVDSALYDIFPYGDGCAAAVFFDAFTSPTLVARPFVDRIRIEFTAGYGSTAAKVPQPLRQAILFLVAHLYENRAPVAVGVSVATLPMAIESLSAPYKIYN